jgi:hypothetical protein
VRDHIFLPSPSSPGYIFHTDFSQLSRAGVQIITQECLPYSSVNLLPDPLSLVSLFMTTDSLQGFSWYALLLIFPFILLSFILVFLDCKKVDCECTWFSMHSKQYIPLGVVDESEQQWRKQLPPRVLSCLVFPSRLWSYMWRKKLWERFFTQHTYH